MDLLGVPKNHLKHGTSNPGKVSSSPGGVGRNIAENLVHLGQTCYLIAPIGDDANGLFLQHHGQQLGIQTQGMVTLVGQSTSIYLSIVDEVGDMQVSIADMALIEQFGELQLEPFLTKLQGAKLVVLDTNLAPHCLAYLMQHVPQQRFFVDTVSVAKATRISPFLSNIHSLKPNLMEAQAIAGTDFGTQPSKVQLLELAQWFITQGVQHLYLSLGSKGLLYSDAKQTFMAVTSAPLESIDIINSNGAGDAMMAAISDAWLLGCDASQRVARALACAHIAIASETTISPHLSPHFLTHMLKENPCIITPLK